MTLLFTHSAGNDVAAASVASGKRASPVPTAVANS